MVKVLPDQFLELQLGICDKTGGIGPGRHQCNLIPEDQAVAIRQFMYPLAVLIVGQPDRVRAHLANDGNTLLDVLLIHRPALSFHVLVQAHAQQP